MPGFTENFFALKNLPFLPVALAFLAFAAVLFAVYRYAFGRQLRLPRNGRTRQPRLGIVDVFDLDRRRQLVIVRRDNIEHLLMIGGPNDLVVESEIVRAESRNSRGFREARLRDWEQRESSPLAAEDSWPAAGEDVAQDPRPLKRPPPAAGREREAAYATSSNASRRDPAPDGSPAPPDPPNFPWQARRGPPPLKSPGQSAAAQRAPLPARGEAPQKRETAAKSAAGVLRAPVAAPFLRSLARRQAQGTGASPAPPAAEAPLVDPKSSRPAGGLRELPPMPERDAAFPAPAPAAAASSAPVGPALDHPSAGQTQDGGTLEDEMARLLGRGRR